MSKIALAIDIGGSKYVVGLVDEGGKIIAQARNYWTELTPQNVVASIVDGSQTLLKENAAIMPSVIGVTIPGLADPQRGYWLEASFSGIQDLAIGQLLCDAFDLPVFIENDGQACALAEQHFGTAKGEKDFVYLTVSNGIGGAIVSDGRLIRGANGHAGEFGHCIVESNGRNCKCGNCGCLEVYAAGPAIVKNYIELQDEDGSIATNLDAKRVGDLARAGDVLAIETYRKEGVFLGTILAQACNMLNTTLVVIGGGISLDFDLFGDSLRQTIERSVYRRANRNIEVKPSILQHNGGLMGAATVAFLGLSRPDETGTVVA